MPLWTIGDATQKWAEEHFTCFSILPQIHWESMMSNMKLATLSAQCKEEVLTKTRMLVGVTLDSSRLESTDASMALFISRVYRISVPVDLFTNTLSKMDPSYVETLSELAKERGAKTFAAKTGIFNKEHAKLADLNADSWGQANVILGAGVFNKEHPKLAEFNADSWGQVSHSTSSGMFNKEHPTL